MLKSLVNRWLPVLSVLLVLSGGVYLFSVHMSVRAAQQYSTPGQKNILISDTASMPDISAVGGISEMILPSAEISLPVKIATYNPTTRGWSLNSTHAFFMRESATPLIYGHAIPAVFGPLSQVKINDLLTLQTSYGDLSFRYIEDEFVAPDDTTLLTRRTSNTIYVMTCDGLFSERRRVLHFEYISEKA